MAGWKANGTRERLIFQYIALLSLLRQENLISIKDISQSLKMHPTTVRRWINSMCLVADLRIEKGIVIIERQHPDAFRMV